LFAEKEDNMVPLQSGQEAILEELELAHVYIEQLHRRIEQIEAGL
jgi:hypothetical protein